MARIITPAPFLGGHEIAKNSLSIKYGDPIAIKSGFVALAVSGDKIEGVSVETKEFSATNQTVGKRKLEFARTHDDMVLEFEVTNGTIAQANVGSVYNLTATQTVDGATSATGVQLMLRKVLTTTLGEFVRAK